MLGRTLRAALLTRCQTARVPSSVLGRPAAPRAQAFSWERSVARELDGQPDAVLWGLLGINGAVFAAWQVVDPRLMARHFTVSHDALRSGRLHTLVTSSVSHRDGWHLAGNGLSLYFFGREVGRLFGGARLAGLYLAGGVVASLSHVAWSRVRQPEHQRRLAYFAPPSPAAMGASGAVNAIIVFDTLMFPWRIIYVNFLVPVPAIVLGGLVLLRDAYGAGQLSDGVAHAGHLGGAATGLAAWAQLHLRLR